MALAHPAKSSLVVNPVTLRAVPYSTLGAGIAYFPSEKLYGALVVMDTEESSGHDKLDTDGGTTVSSEWYANYEIGDLPGGQMVGAVYGDSDFISLGQNLTNFIPNLGTVESEDSSWAVYHNAYQMLQSHGKDATGYRGWGLGTRLGLSDGDPNPVEWFASVMLGGRGLASSRPLDRFGIGYYFPGLSDENIVGLLPVDDEQGVELFYSYALAPSLYITTDLQFIDTGLETQEDAWIAGLRMFFRF